MISQDAPVGDPTNVASDAERREDEGGVEEASAVKCSQCSRKARKGCNMALCFKCCTDSTCKVHQEQRDQLLFKEQVLQGTTPMQLALRQYQAKKILPGRFKERGFTYMGDTVVIWNLKEYLANPKWKDDALRKSIKRNARRLTETCQPKRRLGRKGKRERFQQVMEQLYEQSLQTSSVTS